MAISKIEIPDIGTIELSRRRGLKNIRLSVTHNGAVRLSLPWYVPKAVGIEFIKSKKEWIKKHPNQKPAITKDEEEILRQKTVDEVIPRLRQLAKIYSKQINKTKAKKLRSRWGSCDQDKNISLSLYLAQLPPDLVDYVLCHELAHTKHLNHSRKFWQEVSLMAPNYKILKKELKKFNPGRTL